MEARIANQTVDFLVKQRVLQLNRDKSVFLIVGSKKQKREASLELKDNPLKFGDFCTKEKQEEKWLGQYLSGLGPADSVAKTVEAREGKIRGACMEIACIVNDWRATVAGGMETALLLWEACCLPSLLLGAGTWVDMSRETERRLKPYSSGSCVWSSRWALAPPCLAYLGLHLPEHGSASGKGEGDAGPALQETGGGRPGRPGIQESSRTRGGQGWQGRQEKYARSWTWRVAM